VSFGVGVERIFPVNATLSTTSTSFAAVKSAARNFITCVIARKSGSYQRTRYAQQRRREAAAKK
jgi:hypothetical protein